MKRCTMMTCGALGLAGALFSYSGRSDDRLPAGGETDDPKMAEMVKKVEEAGKPGSAHHALDALAGDWNVEARCFMPGSEAAGVNRGTSSSHWIFGGRFLQEDFKGEFMGKTFKGTGLTGYDNLKQKYVG